MSWNADIRPIVGERGQHRYEKYRPHSEVLSQRSKYLLLGVPVDPQCGHFGIFAISFSSSSANTSHNSFGLEATVAIPAVIGGDETDDSANQNGARVHDDRSSTSQSHNRSYSNLYR